MYNLQAKLHNYLYDLGLVKEFVNEMQKASTTIKDKIGKFNYTNIKNLFIKSHYK